MQTKHSFLIWMWLIAVNHLTALVKGRPHFHCMPVVCCSIWIFSTACLGLKTERYSQRQVDYPEDPRFVQSPTVSTHATPDIKDRSPPYQPDSSNTAVDLDVQTAAEDEDPVAPALATECPADASGFDHIVDELVSGFSSEVEQLLGAKQIFYVSCSSTQGSRELLQTPVVPLSKYVSNYNTPVPISNYISSFHDSLMVFIDPQHVSQCREDVTSSSSAAEVPLNIPDTSSSFNPCASSNTFKSSPTPCSPSSALPDLMTQPPPHSSLPEPDIQQTWALEQDSVPQKTQDANVPHEMNDSLVAETTGAVEGHPAVLAEDGQMGHTHSAISSIIDQLQPEVISNLVKIIKGVQKNVVYFYIHSTDQEESDVCWEIKVHVVALSVQIHSCGSIFYLGGRDVVIQPKHF